MLHLFQLEHYEPARLRVWVQRRGARVTGGALVLCARRGRRPDGRDRGGPRRARAVARVRRRCRARRRRASESCGARRPSRSSSPPRAAAVRRRARAPGCSRCSRSRSRSSPARRHGSAPAVGTGVAIARRDVGRPGAALRRERRRQADPGARQPALRPARRAQARPRSTPLVIGITGSFGKTTTKACVAAVAELRGPAYATPASLQQLPRAWFAPSTRGSTHAAPNLHRGDGRLPARRRRRALRARPSEDRRAHGDRPGPPRALRLARRDREGQGRARRGRCRPTAPSSRPRTTSAAGAPPSAPRRAWCCSARPARRTPS